MRVLMTADPIGGVWSYAVELCAALAAEGIAVTVATLGARPSGAQEQQLARLPNVTMVASALRLEWMPEPWDDLARAGEWLLSLERAVRPDVIHLNHLVHADLPWRAPVVSVGHSCVASWWAAVRGTALPPEWATYRQRVTRSLQAADYVIAPTRAMLAELTRYYGPFRATAVIHNARDHRQFGAGPKEQIVLAAGRIWDEAKNIGALAAVAAEVSAPIFVAGDITGPHGTAPAMPSLSLLGALDSEHLRRWYARAAVYALPARYEPFGLTALEAALSGCALVLGDIQSLREVWGGAARYVHPQHLEGLRDTLNEVLGDAALRSELAAAALQRARQLTPEYFASQYRSVYRELCDGHAFRNVLSLSAV